MYNSQANFKLYFEGKIEVHMYDMHLHVIMAVCLTLVLSTSPSVCYYGRPA